MSWPTVAFGDIFEISSAKRVLKRDWRASGVPFYRSREIVSLAKYGRAKPDVFISEKTYSEYRRKYEIPKAGDLMISAIGSVGSAYVVTADDKFYYKDASVLRLAPKIRIHPPFFLHAIRHRDLQQQILRRAGSTVNTLTIDRAKKLQLRLPSLEEQERIAAILDKADAIRRKRERAMALTDDLLKSVFLDMFGDPVTNPAGLPQQRLSDCSNFISGATPSKSNPTYWSGHFPWVSPKDMKNEYIDTSLDSISEVAFQETSLKKIRPNTPLIVVRGMILAHTVPLGITTRAVAINQDIKAIDFVPEIDPMFGLWSMRTQHNYILSKVSTAAHGTKRLDLDDLGKVRIPTPPMEMQQAFVQFVHRQHELSCKLQATDLRIERLLGSLGQKAFNGELTACEQNRQEAIN